MTRFEITFLGTTAMVPTPKRNHPSIYVRYVSAGEKCFLLDCGEGTQRQIISLGLNFMRIDRIFITHWHADHFLGLLGLVSTMTIEKRKRPLYVYAPEAEKFVPQFLSIGYAARKFKVIPVDVPYEGREKTTIFEDDELKVESVPVKHGIPAVAYAIVEKDRVKIDHEKASELGLPKKSPIFKRIKKFGKAVYKGIEVNLKDISYVEHGKKVSYSGDTMPCSNMVELAKDSDILIHESTYFEEFERYHTTFEQALEIAEKANVKNLIVTHISRRYQDDNELRKIIKSHKTSFDVDLAVDGMKLVLE